MLYRNTAARGAHRLTKNFRPVLNLAFSPNFRKFAPQPQLDLRLSVRTEIRCRSL